MKEIEYKRLSSFIRIFGSFLFIIVFISTVISYLVHINNKEIEITEGKTSKYYVVRDGIDTVTVEELIEDNFNLNSNLTDMIAGVRELADALDSCISENTK